MKKLTSILVALIVISAAHGFGKRMHFVVEQVRLLEEVGGSAVGYAGTPHDFYLLYRYAAFASTEQDIKAAGRVWLSLNVKHFCDIKL
jgi:hypothetical protein